MRAKLRVENLAFGYGARRIGTGVDFELAGGEVMCLLGPNGSGKTTLFKTLLGLLPRQDGRILVDGECMAGSTRRRFAQAMAYVPQSQAGYFPFTVEQTVLMGRASRISLFSLPTQKDAAVASQCMEVLGIGHLAGRLVAELSGGERQLVMIARALAQEPRILVMDEPTSSLDFGNRLRVLDQTRRLADSGIAVILSTHDPAHAFHIADRVALLHRGRLAGLGRPEAIITSENLRLVYDADVSVVSVTQQGKPHWVCLPDNLSDREKESRACGGFTTN